MNSPRPHRDVSAGTEASPADGAERSVYRGAMIEVVAPTTVAFASANTVAEVAAAIGDPVRAAMLMALMDGRARTAGELAVLGGITAQTASGHLARMVEAGLVVAEKQGRHRYVRLVDPAVAAALESLMAVAAIAPPRHRPTGPSDAALREARTCWDHLAGRLGVALADALAPDGRVVLADGAALVTDVGEAFFCDFGVDLGRRPASRRPLCRACLDWSERRPHLGGRLGAALLDRFLELGWLVPGPRDRALRLTPRGRSGFAESFGVEVSRAPT